MAHVTREAAAADAPVADGAPAHTPSRTVRLLTIVLFAGFLAYCAAFIYHTSFVINGVRYFCLFDDGMISLRFAKNLEHGYGLVWNPGGERVEGFSNPLWVAYMAAWHLLPISAAKISLPIQITSALCLFGALFYVRRIAYSLSNGSHFAALSAVALTGFYLPILNWSLQGMEVGLLVLLVTAAIYHTLQSRTKERFSLLPYLLLGMAMLVRFDALVMVGGLMLFGMGWDRKRWWRHALAGIATLALFGGGQTLFRLWYFGELFPNTYYLKMTGFPTAFRLLRGLYNYEAFLVTLPWWLLIPAFVPIFRKRTRGAVLLLLLFAAQSLYSIYVGGDAWEWWGGSNRYLCIAMPPLFILVALGITQWLQQAREEFANKGPRVARVIYATALTVVLVSVGMSNACGPTTLQEWLFLSPPLHRTDNEINLKTAALLTEVTTQHARIGITWAGAIPYFSDRTYHDILGKNDRHIAHETVHLFMNWGMASAFIPGHLKYDFDYTIKKLQPDIMLRDISRGYKEKEYFNTRYRSFYLGEQLIYAKLNSPNIHWKRLYQLDAEEKARMLSASYRTTPRTKAPEGALP